MYQCQSCQDADLWSSLASASQLLASLLDPATYTNQDYRIRIMTFCLYNTTLLKSMRHNKDSNLIPNMESILIQLATFYEPYYYATSLLVEKYQRRPNTPYMTRPKLLHMLTTELLVEPFFLDHISQHTLTTLALKLPLRDILKTVTELFLEPTATTLDDTAVAGLLMNLTVLSDAESGKHLEGVLVSWHVCWLEGRYLNVLQTNYAEAIQLLLARLPVSYLTDPSEQENTDAIDMGKWDGCELLLIQEKLLTRRY